MNSPADVAAGASGNSRRPVVGITAHTGPVKIAIFDMHATLVPQIFVERVTAAGCIPVLLPSVPGTEHVISRLDGLLILAGPDVDPSLYSAPRHPMTARVDSSRDAAELGFLEAAISGSVPILGICRGLQLLNTLRCGTLHQHLPDLISNETHSPGDGVYGPQHVQYEPGSRLAKIMGNTDVVSCHHHQAIDQLGAGLTATAWADDGIIEAVELADHPFAVAVQWHAEESEDRGLFTAFAEAAQHHQRFGRS